jgi:hypothetical protein
MHLMPLPQTVKGRVSVRREDLLKPDLICEVILLGAGAVLFMILLLILFAAITQSPAHF